ncbi:hypothetical protein OIU91_16400 [Streptomyces sp. NBC_01456]|uniref:hypothetical protein n=1 Tax=Streptomyces sp. NBC_01456 TaxID=2975868 RepID=UPI002E333F89|nr:hypothetical protein [Streptomyces sp. NBC_01456]
MEDKLVTDAEVYAHVETIPPELADCLAERHQWVPYDWHGYNANGGIVRQPRNAVAIDLTQRCNRCDMLRHTTMTMGRRGPIDRTDFTYSNRNPALVSPVGISQTGISVRRELGMGKLWDGIVEAPIPLHSKQGKNKAARGAA